MDIVSEIATAVAKIAAGRASIAKVADAIKDGTAIVSADTQAQIDALLADEPQESRDAYAALDAAIKARLTD